MATMTIAGARPVGELVDVFVIYDDGTAGHLQVDARVTPTLSRAGTIVTKEQYGERARELRDRTAAHVARLMDEDEARRRTDLAALLGAGVPEETARRMAGYHDGQR